MHTNNTPIRLLAEEERPREKLMLKGRTALSDAELLAILIGSGNREFSALDLARQILRNCDLDLVALGRWSVEEYCKMPGMGPAKALTVQAALELGRRRASAEHRKKPLVQSSQDAFQQLRAELVDLNHEEFWVLYLRSGSKLIQRKRISMGGITGTVADVRLILRTALELRATAMIVAHNHPSGNLKPSEPDIRLTKKLREASDIMDVKLLDHIIIGDGDYFSFADEGLVF